MAKKPKTEKLAEDFLKEKNYIERAIYVRAEHQRKIDELSDVD